MGEEGREPHNKALAGQPLVQPEGRGSPTDDGTTSHSAVEGQANCHNLLQEGRRRREHAKVPAGVPEVPLLPGKALRLVEFMDEVEKQALVLPVEIPDTKATFLFRQQNFIPSN
jgi:hypothetical protein